MCPPVPSARSTPATGSQEGPKVTCKPAAHNFRAVPQRTEAFADSGAASRNVRISSTASVRAALAVIVRSRRSRAAARSPLRNARSSPVTSREDFSVTAESESKDFTFSGKIGSKPSFGTSSALRHSRDARNSIAPAVRVMTLPEGSSGTSATRGFPRSSSPTAG